MKLLRIAAIAALALMLTLSATTADAKKKKPKQCHDDVDTDTDTVAAATILTPVPVLTPAPALTVAAKATTLRLTTDTPTTTATPQSTETAAPKATSTLSKIPTATANKSNAPAPPGLKLKLSNKVGLDGKKLAVKTVTDVCYSVDACFDDLTSSLAWSKTPSDTKAIELFASAGCKDASVSITDLGVSGNVTSLKSLGFNNKVSSFVVRSVEGNGLVVDQDSGCSDQEYDDDKDEAASNAEPTTSSSPATTPAPTTISTPVPVTTATTLASKVNGLKIKLYKKVDQGDGDDKLVVPTLSDVCYSVDACFDDLTKSLEWTKVPSDVRAIELFDAVRCTGASVVITVLKTAGNVTTLKDLDFMKKLSAFVVRSKSGNHAIASYDDGCAIGDSV